MDKFIVINNNIKLISVLKYKIQTGEWDFI